MRAQTHRIGLHATADAESFSVPRINRMTPAMLLIMLAMTACGIFVGYQISHGIFVSLVFGGVFGRIGMWLGMISCGLVAGLEEYLQGIFG